MGTEEPAPLAPHVHPHHSHCPARRPSAALLSSQSGCEQQSPLANAFTQARLSPDLLEFYYLGPCFLAHGEPLLCATHAVPGAMLRPAGGEGGERGGQAASTL